jgi:hypothetical protein
MRRALAIALALAGVAGAIVVAGRAPVRGPAAAGDGPGNAIPASGRPFNGRAPRPQDDPDEVPCGGGRWLVKTLADARSRRIPSHRYRVSISALRHVRTAGVNYYTPRRRRYETRIFRSRVRLRGFSYERDRDIHLIVGDSRHPGNTMVTELPDPRCRSVRRSRFFGGMLTARATLRRHCGRAVRGFHPLHGSATITGVGFFDNPHEQTGGAPNGVELHPVIGLTHITCRRVHRHRHRHRHRRRHG